MKKVILAIVLAVSAFAGMVENTTVGYGNVEVTANVNGQSGTTNTKTTSVRQDLGYEFNRVRVVGYIQLDKYKDDIPTSTAGNATSYGIEVDYIQYVNDKLGFFVGGLAGKGSKSLGSDGDVVGIGTISFDDLAIRGGMTYQAGIWQLEVGFENKIRNYDNVTIGEDVFGLEEQITSVFMGAGYKF